MHKNSFIYNALSGLLLNIGVTIVACGIIITFFKGVRDEPRPTGHAT